MEYIKIILSVYTFHIYSFGLDIDMSNKDAELCGVTFETDAIHPIVSKSHPIAMGDIDGLNCFVETKLNNWGWYNVKRVKIWNIDMENNTVSISIEFIRECF